jgi:glucoamylase
MSKTQRQAPGHPGSKPRWTSAAKSGVGTALTASRHATSLVWFTLGHGILTEVFYPRPDIPCTRNLVLVVTDGQDFLSEEEDDTRHETAYVAEGVPAYHLTNTCHQGRYCIDKTVFAHPRHHAVIQRARFTPLEGRFEDYHLYALLAPHLGGQGAENTAWVMDYKGQRMLFAQRQGFVLALACSAGWARGSAGFVGASDGWQELRRHKRLTRTYDRAEGGNVILAGEVDLAACGGEFVLALGFGADPGEAGHRVRASLLEDLEAVQEEYIRGWQDYQKDLLPLEGTRADDGGHYRISTAVMAVHEGKSITGTVASLSVPWGTQTADNERLEGGYHLVWPRDLVETAGGLLAAGAREDTLRRLLYLAATQEVDGHWAQNMWMPGDPFWTAIQLCETGLPVLLVDLLRREGLDPTDEARLWPMVRAAADYLVQRGPCTDEDRWEREPGYTPFTLAVIIAALLAAAEMAEAIGEPFAASSLRQTADAWNACIEGWLYVTDTALARRTGVEGYYARALTPEVMEPAAPGQGSVRLLGHPPKKNGIPVTEIVSPDALALVRYGLRAADDPRIVNTLKVIDALLKVETPFGPCWRRFNGDDYGETKDGEPFPGHGKGGIGRAWPLLTGERAHYELAAGRREEGERLLRVMAAFANDGGMLPEQIWDTDDIPERGLFLGRATGSAMPLAWAHAEYVKLLRSLRDGRVFDTPSQTVERYLPRRRRSRPTNRKLRPVEENHDKSNGAPRPKRAAPV